MERGVRCPRCGGLLPEDAAFCAYCGATIDGSAVMAPIAPRPEREPAIGIYPSDVAYLFSDRFVPRGSTLEWFFGEGNVETPCSDKSVKRRDLARMLLVTAIVHLATTGVISLSLGKRRSLGGVLMPNTVMATKLSQSALDPTSLEGVLAANLAEPKEQSIYDLVRALVKQSGTYVQRLRSHDLVIRVVSRHLIQHGLLREVEARGLGGITARVKTVGVCERILPLEPYSTQVSKMLLGYRDANRRIYSGLLDDVYNAIYSVSSMIP